MYKCVLVNEAMIMSITTQGGSVMNVMSCLHSIITSIHIPLAEHQAASFSLVDDDDLMMF